MNKILIVDDDTAIAQLVSDALEDEGFDTHIENDGAAALSLIEQSEPFSLIILDIMMPKLDGLALCRKIRDTVSCPIVFVTAKSRTLDTMVGLEMGADDYIYKAFVVEELVARVKAHLRRESRYQQADTSSPWLCIGPFRLNRESFEVFCREEPVALSTREFQLLQYLMENAGRVLSREQIFDAVWGEHYGDIGTVAVNIKNLRTKLDPDSQFIKTIWGVGYKFVKVQEAV